jgi:hypothetical protein
MVAGVVRNMGFPGPLTPTMWQYTTTSLSSACLPTVSYVDQLQATAYTNTFYAAPLQQHPLDTPNPTAPPQTQVCASSTLPNMTRHHSISASLSCPAVDNDCAFRRIPCIHANRKRARSIHANRKRARRNLQNQQSRERMTATFSQILVRTS